MNKKGFVDRLTLRFLSNASDDLALMESEDLERTLPDNLDFDSVYDEFLKRYEKRSMPMYKDIEPFFKYRSSDSDLNSIYWDLTVTTNNGDYSFAIPMKYTVEQAKATYRKKGWFYVSDNWQEVRYRYGLD